MSEAINPHIGRRRDSRLRVAMPATLILLTGHLRVSLCDVSQSGARFRIPEEIATGCDGVLTWLDFETFGTIVWVRGGFAGLEFDEPLDAAVLIKTRDRIDHGQVKSEKQVAYEESRKWFHGYQ